MDTALRRMQGKAVGPVLLVEVADDTLWLPERIILRHLMDTRRGWTMRELTDLVYSGREDGGPDTASELVRHYLWSLRSKLRPGWHISTNWLKLLEYAHD